MDNSPVGVRLVIGIVALIGPVLFPLPPIDMPPKLGLANLAGLYSMTGGSLTGVFPVYFIRLLALLILIGL